MMDVLLIVSTSSVLFLSWLFFYSGLHKLNSSYLDYYEVVFTEYGVGSRSLARALPKVIGMAETLLAISLVVFTLFFPAFKTYASYLSIAFLIVYFLLISKSFVQGKHDVDCGCAGPEGGLKFSGHLIFRNLVLIAVALLSLFSVGISGVVSWSMALALSIVFILMYLSCEQAIANAQRIKLLKS